MPAELDADAQCPLHFTLSVEQRCAELRRETVGAPPDEGRRAEIVTYIGHAGQTLARLATGELRLPDEMKARILATFLTLMNLRENMDRALARQRLRREAEAKAKATNH